MVIGKLEKGDWSQPGFTQIRKVGSRLPGGPRHLRSSLWQRTPASFETEGEKDQGEGIITGIISGRPLIWVAEEGEIRQDKNVSDAQTSWADRLGAAAPRERVFWIQTCGSKQRGRAQEISSAKGVRRNRGQGASVKVEAGDRICRSIYLHLPWGELPWYVCCASHLTTLEPSQTRFHSSRRV